MALPTRRFNTDFAASGGDLGDLYPTGVTMPAGYAPSADKDVATKDYTLAKTAAQTPFDDTNVDYTAANVQAALENGQFTNYMEGFESGNVSVLFTGSVDTRDTGVRHFLGTAVTGTLPSDLDTSKYFVMETYGRGGRWNQTLRCADITNEFFQWERVYYSTSWRAWKRIDNAAGTPFDDTDVAYTATTVQAALEKSDYGSSVYTSKDCGFYTGGSSGTGAILFLSDYLVANNHMIQLEFDYYGYQTQKGATINLGFYGYSTTPAMLALSCTVSGLFRDDMRIRVGRQTSSGKIVVIFGETTTTRDYSKYHLKKVTSYSGTPPDTMGKWTSSLVTSLSGYDLLEDFIVPGVWKTVTDTVGYSNSWTTYNSNYKPAYMLDNNGVVHLRGLVSGGTENAAAFTLPVGYRPPNPAEYFVQAIGNSGIGRVNVTDTGTVVPNIVLVGSAGDMNAWTSLDGISFSRVPDTY